MNQGSLLTAEIVSGSDLVHLVHRVLPVTVAFWLKASDELHRYLYIASKEINDASTRWAYEVVMRQVNEMRSESFDPFRVKVISAESPLAKAALEFNERFTDENAPRFGGRVFSSVTFGGITVDDVYVYPSPKPASVG